MLETVILAAVQGIGEWLPISSSGLLVLVQTWFWPQTPLSQMIEYALFLHAGTLLAAAVYFYKDIKEIVFKKAKVLKTLVITTLISGGLGFLLLQALKQVEQEISLTGKIVTALVGLFLIVTGIIQIKDGNHGTRKMEQARVKDGVLLGLIQALTVLPGFSRSGLTICLLLNLGFEKVEALKLSFLAGMPIIFAGNILLNLNELTSLDFGWGLIVSFVVGIASISFLFKLAKKINFGYFVTFFGLLTLISSFI